MPTRGERRLRSTSTARAFIGEMYRTRHLRRGSEGGEVVARRSSAQRNAESVLPEPVGATTRVWAPELMASQAPTCASVGSAKLPLNQSRVAGENRASTSELIVSPACHLSPTTGRQTGASRLCRMHAGSTECALAHPKGGEPVEMGTGFCHDPSMTARPPSGAVSEIRTSLAP